MTDRPVPSVSGRIPADTSAPDADTLEQAEHQAIGWLLAGLHRDHPGWLDEQAKRAERFAATNPLANDRTSAMAETLRRWADER